MTTRVIPISAEAMTDFLERHEPTWERFKEVTDDTMIESDYGYGVDIIGNTKSSEMLFNACLDIYESDEETNYADMSIIANLIRDANQGNGNILVCSSSHVQDLCDNAFKMSSCELSTQSLFITLLSRTGGKWLLWVSQTIAPLRGAMNSRVISVWCVMLTTQRWRG